ncbi:unnamed protein product [Cylicocyclus nassatus]|uniref:Uncharacterized protein n=1 Tax=Cylicocyclus nassatus TaxID=53992 RepID=A0AA36HCF2_CYLNA|nr:unnamed protein product [Cylicocyclus nassatus]
MQFEDVSVKQISVDCGVCYKRMSLANIAPFVPGASCGLIWNVWADYTPIAHHEAMRVHLTQRRMDERRQFDSPGVDDDLADSAEATTNAHRASLVAQVLVEVAVNVGNVGSSMLGYVEDNDESAVEYLPESVKAEYGSVVVKEVHDDNNDDELQVIGEVEHARGVTSSAVVTKRSTNARDAALCLWHTLKGFFSVCRNCCAAFESQQQFKNRRLCHGPAGSVSCGECSAIAYIRHYLNIIATPTQPRIDFSTDAVNAACCSDRMHDLCSIFERHMVFLYSSSARLAILVVLRRSRYMYTLL